MILIMFFLVSWLLFDMGCRIWVRLFMFVGGKSSLFVGGVSLVVLVIVVILSVDLVLFRKLLNIWVFIFVFVVWVVVRL